MYLCYPFPGTQDAPLGEVGGKARSLLLFSKAGFNVPPGFVLSTGFFSPWLEHIRQSRDWQRVTSASEAEMPALWQSLKEGCRDLRFDADSRALLNRAFEALAGNDHDGFQVVAVRSSAPEEDLEGASFAGGYLSLMGVTRSTLHDAIRQAFASCLDHRVYVYKRMRGFDPFDPRIAVVVQRQIASEIAGVGFSLNPLTNDFDEAVINSNWGLGETVVAGSGTPDTFVVDKPSARTLATTLGSKELSLWLDAAGNTIMRHDHRSGETTLSPDQVVSVTRLIGRVENYSGKPMDIEWCYAAGDLFLLQARPITAFLPVSQELMTAPGMPRQLYLDVTISVQGIGKPLSVIGTATLQRLLGTLLQRVVGRDLRDFLFDRSIRFEHGRLYANLSTAMNLFGQDRVAAAIAGVDTAASATVRAADASRYTTATGRLPFKLKLGLLRNMPRWVRTVLRLWKDPEAAHSGSQQAFARYRSEMQELSLSRLPLLRYADAVVARTASLIGDYSAPLFLASRIANAAIQRLFPDDPRALQLNRGLPHNMTVEMGLDLAKLAALLPRNLSTGDIERGISERILPGGFLAGWQDFLDRYGHRGPREIDLASSRYRDDPAMLRSQLAALTLAADPSLRHRRVQAERDAAYQSLLAGARGLKRFLLRRLYRALVQFGGYRETHKYFLAQALWSIKQRVLAEAAGLQALGRLDALEQAFDLTLEQLAAGRDDPPPDLRAIARRNRSFPDKLAAVPTLPQVFDSRGRILRPPAAMLKPGEWAGAPISAGIARGPAKVLRSPDQKPFLSGDILVARATDPGWTPLFASAAAVVLEVGGMLQHGALVAREYGLPCVAGITNATSLFEDDSLIEVDGSAGIVRIIAKPVPASSPVSG
jgi:rifampicin phosphotransferase